MHKFKMQNKNSLFMFLSLLLVIFSCLSSISLAQNSSCDYKVDVLLDGQEFATDGLKWKVRASRIDGEKTNITAISFIKRNDGKIARNYKIWNKEKISEQKTSKYYSPILESGDYEIVAAINVSCYDLNLANNMDKKKVKITGDDIEIWDYGHNESNSKNPNCAAQRFNAVYKSSGEKSKEVIVYILLGLSMLLNIVLIWKR